MERGLRRRDFLRLSGAGAAAAASGCQALGSGSSESVDTPPIEGTVFDLDGEPIGGATVEAVVGGDAVLSEASTDESGGFSIDPDAGPVWLRVASPGFITRTVAAEPGRAQRVALTPRDGTVSMSFGGDVMFGRRFYEDSESPGCPWFSIRESEREEDHREILKHIQPLLGTADITSVNLETTLTTSEWRHSSKRFVYTSHPEAAPALKEAGVEYAALGNNHIFDALKPGLDDTFEALALSGIAHSGAGNSSEEAWEPAYFEEQGLTVGLISCATIVGAGYNVDWSADRGESERYSFTQDIEGESRSISFSGGVGVAEASEERLAERVAETSNAADITVVQIHGGEEYQRTPTDEIERLTDAASGAGADLVVNHHPHVTGGLERRGDTLVAWTLGNLVFDQVLWETFPSYLLTVHATDDGVKRAYVDSLLVDGYVPKGAVGEPMVSQLRRTAGLSSEEFSLRRGTVEYAKDRHARTRTETQSFEGGGDDGGGDGGGEIFERESGWVRGVVEGSGSVELGRDLFPTGSFDESIVDRDGHDAPLWRMNRVRADTGPGVGVDGSRGVSISRHQSNSSRIILSQCARNFFSGGSLTLTGLYKYGADEGLEILVKWHRSSGDMSALDEETHSLSGTGGEWERMRKDLRPPEGASYLDLYFRFYPPSPRFPVDLKTERVVALDELRLIEWNDADSGRGYDHLRVNGPATVEFAASGGANTGTGEDAGTNTGTDAGSGDDTEETVEWNALREGDPAGTS